jgi:transposase
MLAIDSLLEQGAVVVGVDTHKHVHHAAVLTITGQLVADAAFPADAAGYQALADWAAGFGAISRVGVELTGSYGAGLTRHLTAAGLRVVEVNTTDKATRARRGKDDRIDAIAAAQKVLAGMATATPKDTSGAVESIRMLLLTRNSAIRDRTAAINQLRNLIITAPAGLRARLEIRGRASLLTAVEAQPLNRARLADPAEATVFALQRLVRRIRDLEAEIRELDKAMRELVAATAPTLLSQRQVGVQTAAQLLVTAAANIDRIGSEAQFAHLTGTAPIPVSSGKTTRMRLHRGGDRQANRAIHLVAVGRLKNHPPTQAYVAKKLAEGKSKKDAIRSLKRYIARGCFHALKTDLNRT